MRRRVNELRSLVGPTPLVEIGYAREGRRGRIFAKWEAQHLTGSIKDRMAVRILEEAEREGRLEGVEEIVEASSGNTGLAFAAIGRCLGLRVTIAMPDWMSRERFTLLEALGARVVPFSAEAGGFPGAVAWAREEARRRSGVFCPAQFDNPANVRAHRDGTAREAIEQLDALDLEIDGFVAGVGTGGTVMGFAEALGGAGRAARVHPVEPAESRILSCGRKTGHHRIQGISDDFVPSIVRLDLLDGPIAVKDGLALGTARALAAEVGLGVGISSGANVAAALELAERLGEGAVVVTVLPDSHKKYLSTDLFAPGAERVEPPSVRFVSVRALPAR